VPARVPIRRRWTGVALTGAGEKALCAGGDIKHRTASGDNELSITCRDEVETLHHMIRDIPKPVIPAVNGFSIGDGHVLHFVCDLMIAADTARFGHRAWGRLLRPRLRHGVPVPATPEG
jgi:1,4-dihydroxy-2-naphthoyl-CoA synthase